MIRVFFNLSPRHRVRFRETVWHPPPGVIYVNKIPPTWKDTNISPADPLRERATNLLKKVIDIFRIPNIRLARPNLPCDLIHAPGQLLLNRQQWVTEIDNPAVLTLYNLNTLYSRIGQFWIKRFLRSRHCGGVIAISQAAKKSLANVLRDDEINSKTSVVYPFVRLSPFRKKPSEHIRLLYVSTSFFRKGARELLKAFERLNKMFPNKLSLTLVTNAPKEYISRYSRFPNIRLLPANIPKEILYRDFFSDADIFVVPTYQDSFGLVNLEAMSAGLPVVATDLFALPEMVEDGRNGFLLPCPIPYFRPDYTPNPAVWSLNLEEYCSRKEFPEIVNGLIEKLTILIEDEKLRRQMGERSLKAVKEGKFSEKVRAASLIQAYRRALGE
ncbi:MAG: glycosyltransferase family 4 protein [Candidatus Micrarchaeia archaeon]